MLKIAPALLERWMREYYFKTEVDIGSSGVECFSLGGLCKLGIIKEAELERIVFEDSPTLGASGLREAIAERWAHGCTERVITTHGSSEAIFLIMNALLSAGDEIVVLDPCYQQLYSIAESIGCSVKRWPLRFEDRFIPDVEKAKKLIGPRTRLVVVNFPHNPTGATLNAEGWQYILAKVASVGAYLVWDAAFADLQYENVDTIDPASFYERCISMGTLSKAYGLPGLRLGWCIASPEVLESFAHFRDYTILHLSPLTELIGQRAIENANAILSRRMHQARLNRAIVGDWIREHGDHVEWVEPQAGVCAFLRLLQVEDVEVFCRTLAESYRTLLVPGTCFNTPGHVRLGFGGVTKALQDGLSRLSMLLSSVSRPRHLGLISNTTLGGAT